MMVHQLFIKQNHNPKNVLTGFKIANSYQILNQHGQRLFYAKEQSENRALIAIVEVIVVDRTSTCSCCCCLCSPQSCTIMAPRGNAVGHVTQDLDICEQPKFGIFDGQNKFVLRIEGPCCICGCDDISFNVLALDGRIVGRVCKKWSRIVQEFFTDEDIFGISFSMDLDVKIKATIIGACFLIDFTYFESDGQNNHQGGGD